MEEYLLLKDKLKQAYTTGNINRSLSDWELNYTTGKNLDLKGGIKITRTVNM